MGFMWAEQADAAHQIRYSDAVCRFATPAVTTPLSRALSDARWQVRLAALSSLCQLEDPALLRVVRPLLRDPHPEVRSAAAEAVAELAEGDEE
jgi:HEAT repeat protein